MRNLKLRRSSEFNRKSSPSKALGPTCRKTKAIKSGMILDSRV